MSLRHNDAIIQMKPYEFQILFGFGGFRIAIFALEFHETKS